MSRATIEDKMPGMKSCMISYEEVRGAASEDNSIRPWVQLSPNEKIEELRKWNERMTAWHDIARLADPNIPGFK